MQGLYEEGRRFAEGRLRYSHWGYDDIHFFPQSWRCNFDTALSHYTLLHHGSPSFKPSLLGLLGGSGVTPRELDIIRHELVRFPSPEIEVLKRRYMREVVRNGLVRRRLMQMFFYDYVLFGFPLPEWVWESAGQ